MFFIFLSKNNLSIAVVINIQRNCGEKMVNLQANDRRERTREYLDRERIAETRYLLIDCCSVPTASKVFTYLLWSEFVQGEEKLPTSRSIVLANILHHLFLVKTHPKFSLFILETRRKFNTTLRYAKSNQLSI